MTNITVFRHVPRPIIGMVSGVNDRRFATLDESLDWLETTGLLVERFDPSVEPWEVAKRPAAQELLSKGDGCLPLVLVNDVVVLQGIYPSRTQLARAVGTQRHGTRQSGRRAA
jgi:hypothetical protein